MYCGHLGSPNEDWWPDRRGLTKEMSEFEAESVSYLVCARLGLETTSAEYLSGYVEQNKNVPPIRLSSVVLTAGLIEKMSRVRMEVRKEPRTA